MIPFKQKSEPKIMMTHWPLNRFLLMCCLILIATNIFEFFVNIFYQKNSDQTK